MIPTELLPHASGKVAEKQSLGDQAFEFEVPSRLHLAPFAGVEPFALVAKRSRKCLGRLFIAVHLRLRNDFRIAAIKGAEDFAVVSDEEQAFIFLFPIT